MHVAIVGAGPGGLAAAINLASLGVRVTVVEKDPIPGGRMKGLTLGKHNEYSVDSGPTLMHLPEILLKLFARAGKRTEDYVSLVPLHQNTRVHLWDGSHLDTFFQDQPRMEEQFSKFGHEKVPAFRRWLKESREKYKAAYPRFVANAADSMRFYAGFASLFPFKPWQSLAQHYDSYFRDERLMWALGYTAAYTGLHPTRCSSLFSMIPYLEMDFGLWHVQGGFRTLSRGMMRCGEDLGVTFRMGEPVKEVWIEGGRVRGVSLESGERIAADAVVVNADIGYGARKLVDSRWRERSRMSDRALNRALYPGSAFALYLGLDRVYDDLPHHTICVPNGIRETKSSALVHGGLDLDDPLFYVANPFATDRSGAPAGHSTLVLLVHTPNTTSGLDWEEVTAQVIERAPRILARAGFTNIERHIRAVSWNHALTWRDRFNVHLGAVFNLVMNFQQFGPLRPRVRSKEIPGLYWVGGGTHPGNGLRNIFESANIAANYISVSAGKGPLRDWPYLPLPSPVRRAEEILTPALK
jgi:phytoene desaturase